MCLQQGWYGCGFGYGMWVGILMALGFRVVPVRAQAWKSAMGISGRQYTKVWLPLQLPIPCLKWLLLKKLHSIKESWHMMSFECRMTVEPWPWLFSLIWDLSWSAKKIMVKNFSLSSWDSGMKIQLVNPMNAWFFRSCRCYSYCSVWEGFVTAT